MIKKVIMSRIVKQGFCDRGRKIETASACTGMSVEYTK